MNHTFGFVWARARIRAIGYRRVRLARMRESIAQYLHPPSYWDDPGPFK